MGWTSYYVGRNCDRKEECMNYIRGYKDKDGKPTVNLIKSVMKGSKFYALLETVHNEQFILCLLTSIKDGEFYYKDIQCNPYESGVPMSLVKLFKPSNEKDLEWKNKLLAENEKNKTTKKEYKVGDILKCVNNKGYELTWNNGYRIEKGETFFVKVDILNPYAKRKTKMYRIVEPFETNGKRTDYHNTNCRLNTKSFSWAFEPTLV